MLKIPKLNLKKYFNLNNNTDIIIPIFWDTTKVFVVSKLLLFYCYYLLLTLKISKKINVPYSNTPMYIKPTNNFKQFAVRDNP